MEKIRWTGALAAAAAVLLVSCSTPAPEPSGPTVTEHWSVLPAEERLPAVGSRWYPQPVGEFIPSPDYGALVPYIGAVYYLPSGLPGEPVSDTCPSYLYGLMTLEGQTVLDPVCTEIRSIHYTDAQGQDAFLPVWQLTKGDPEDPRSNHGELVALAAQDGSWSTPFQYWGATGSPLGVFAGTREGLSLLDSATGAQTGFWPWEDLGIGQPEQFPWFTGDVYSTAQWTEEGFYLGTWGDDWTALLLDPASGAVTALPDLEWAERLSRKLEERDSTWWDASTGEDGSITLTRDGQSYTFPSPLPEDPFPYVQEDRVIFQDYAGGRFAVTTLEGRTILPAQSGQLEVLDLGESLRLAVCPAGESDWTLYTWKGEPGPTLPGGPESSCGTSGPFAEVRSADGAAYYRPASGICVRRTWFTLEDRTAGLPDDP